MKQIGEIVEIAVGNAWDSKKFNFESTGIPIIRIQNMIGSDRKLAHWDGEFLDKYLINSGDLLVSLSGSFKVDIWKGGKALLNQRIAVVKPKENVNPSFLFYVLSHDINQLAHKATQTSVANLSIESFRTHQIPLPPLPIQKRIAAILEKADAAREKRRQTIELTEKFLQSAFLDMFGDPVTNPKGWETELFGKLCEIRRGASPRPIDKFLGGTVPWIKIGDGTINSSHYIEFTKEHVTEEGAKKSVFVPPGSLIFANCGVSLGFARIMKIGGCIHDGWLSFTNIDKRLNMIFLLSSLNFMTNHFRKIAPSGTQPNLNTGIMRNIDFFIPPLSLQQKFAALVEKVEAMRTKQRASEQELENLFQSLMQRAFKGELVS